VVNGDSIDTAWELQQQGYVPLVLNMASDRHAGGGWLNGAMAQEEALCYRSDLSSRLETVSYPWQMYTGVYTPDVFIFRDGPVSNYQMYRWKDCTWLSFCSVAAIRRPALVKGDYKDHDRRVMKAKIKGILDMAIYHDHDCLVLGALGCGAFGNPPDKVAEIFKEYIEDPEYQGRFKKIVFAILEDRNSARNSAKGNLLTFKEIFEKK
jgi:uncharacterized protein (TIGR02452 family)